MESLPTVDAHEHLPPETDRVSRSLDFFTLFEHYCKGDLVSAGATDDDLAFWQDRSQPVEERWNRFKPYLSAIRTGGYARSAFLVIRDLLGFADLTDDTYLAIGHRLQRGNTPGVYDRVLRDRCRLAACIQCWQLGNPYPGYFFHLAPGPEVIDLVTREKVAALGQRHNVDIATLSDLLDCVTRTVEEWKATPQVVGIKSAHAYSRSLAFQHRPRTEAEAVLAKLLRNSGDPLTPAEATLLQDFLVFELVARAEAVDLPMVFHTGLQAGNRNRITNANPLHLEPLLQAFPTARFDLFHAGMPWVREIAVLAKYFPNVFLNLAWTHIICPAQARSALSEWLDLVPNTKIFGFGGDYSIVEKVYGHLKLARRNIARVLAGKVSEGSFSRAEASLVARRLMFDNPNEFYRLGLTQ